MDYEKLYAALSVIQNVCVKCERCEMCPMGNSDGECLVRDLEPLNWSLKLPDKVIRLMG